MMGITAMIGETIAAAILIPAVLLLAVGAAIGAGGDSARRTPTVEEALASRTDLWGELSNSLPGGPSYEYFAGLLPPLRYVNAEFRHYPIVLSAPGGAPAKFRLISNGSAINAPARLSTWRDNIGTAVSFWVGADKTAFGEKLADLDGPRYANGYLPIVQTRYKHGDLDLRQEVFAGVEASYLALGAAFVRFTGTGEVCVRPISAEGGRWHESDGVLLDSDEKAVLSFGSEWKWDAATGELTCRLNNTASANLIVFTKPSAGTPPDRITTAVYDAQRARCVDVWQALLDRGARIETPEPVVNNAWRSLIIGTLLCELGDAPNYSWGNLYQTMYEAECGDAAVALLQYGHEDEVREMLSPLLDFKQGGLEMHNAAFKLQLMADFYWLTRDTKTLRHYQSRWGDFVQEIADKREQQNGLLPKERYCGDIGTQVYTLNSNANCWRGLRDIAAVLKELGDEAEAGRVLGIADSLRAATLKAVDQSIDRSTKPPFVPIALFGEEKGYDVITSSQMGSYWNLMIPYVLGSNVLGSETNKSIVEYLQQHGGLCMGMTRFDQHSGLFANAKGLDDCFGLRYIKVQLEQDRVDDSLVSFYGKLAQGFTRDTFIGGEGTGLVSSDGLGRDMYLPPNVSGNALFLAHLRYLLVQDWDTDDDGVPDTLRLMFGTPKKWMEDGKSVKVTNAPTAFGKVSVEMVSDLKHKRILAKVAVPAHKPKKMLIRARAPEGWTVISASDGKKTLPVDARGTVDITGREGDLSIAFALTQKME